MKLRAALIYSLALHLGLALSLIHWPYATPVPIVPASLHSFLSSAPTTSHSQTATPSVVKPPLTHTGSPTIPTPAVSAPASSIATTATDASQNNPTLVQLLHDAIQAQQRYPESALAMQRAGVVRVAFVLAPDGTVTALILLHSSGTQSLDTAAFDAIHQATPFQGIAAFIHQATRFQLDIGFVLP